jgi:hypothetical protein
MGVRHALVPEAITECVGNGHIGKTESDVELLRFLRASAAADRKTVLADAQPGHFVLLSAIVPSGFALTSWAHQLEQDFLGEAFANMSVSVQPSRGRSVELGSDALGVPSWPWRRVRR